VKRVVICLFILAAMLTAGTAVYVHTGNIADELDARLSALEKGSPDPVREAEELSEKWEKFCAFNIFLTNIEGAAEVSEALVRVISKAKYDPEDVPEECVNARCRLEHFREGSSLRAENIF